MLISLLLDRYYKTKQNNFDKIDLSQRRKKYFYILIPDGHQRRGDG